MSNIFARNRWLRILTGGVLAEVALLVLAVPLNASDGGRALLLQIVIPACVIATFLGGWWVARKAGGLYWLHGLCVGAIAALIYGALTWNLVLPDAYILANWLKLVGGTAGGLMAQALARGTSSAQ